MIPWLPWERRWRDALVAATIPAVPGVPLPALAELDLTVFWRRFSAAAPPLLRFGLRAAIWCLTLAPPFLIGRWRRFHRLESVDRDRLLVAATTHRRYLVRQLVLTVKLAACFAYCADPAARDALDPTRWPDWRRPTPARAAAGP